MKEHWSPEDAAQAAAKGWALVTVITPLPDNGRKTQRNWRARLEIHPVVVGAQNPKDVLTHVTNQARLGDRLSIKALRLIVRGTP